MPTSLDDYVQECGRIGRDNSQSHAILLTHKDGNKGPHMTAEVKKYSTSTECLRQQILSYFGETCNTIFPPLCCSNCCDAAMSTKCCPCNAECDHRFDAKNCFCVKWCYEKLSFFPVMEKHKGAFTANDRRPCRTEMDGATLVKCREQLNKLSQSTGGAPALSCNLTTQVYTQLIDNLLRDHTHITSCVDILNKGAYSPEAAEKMLAILDRHAPRFSFHTSNDSILYDDDLVFSEDEDSV